MKQVMLAIAGLFVSAFGFGQNVGIGVGTPDNSSILELKSTSKGMLMPRMNTSGITSIVSPAKGLLVLDTTKNQLMINVGTASSPNWQTIVFNSGWNLTGNSNVNAATNFIGTTDNNPLNFRINNLYAGQLHPSLGNVFLGIKSGQSNSSGQANIGIGAGALFRNTVRGNLVAIGDSALCYDGTNTALPDFGSYNTAIGSRALYANTIGYSNTAVGYHALSTNTSGYQNTAVGYGTLAANSNGIDNTAFGYDALVLNSIGANNTAVGSVSLALNTTGYSNTAFGSNAVFSNTTGYSNLGIGVRSLFNNATGSYNVAIGDSALYSTTAGYYNIGVGFQSLYTNTGNCNTATGFQALHLNTNGSHNTATGFEALYSNTSGDNNTAAGYGAMGVNTTGYSNTANGFNSLFFNTSGSSNVAMGVASLNQNSRGIGNTAIGDSSLFSNTEGYQNTGIGFRSLYNTTGVFADLNTAVGQYSLYNNLNGSFNTGIGASADVDMTNSDFNTVVGASAHVSGNNDVAIGYGSYTNVNNLALLGSVNTLTCGGYANWTNFSDGRFKKDVMENVKGLDFILRLKPVTYKMDVRGIYKLWEISPYNDEQSEKNLKQKKLIDDAINNKESIRMTGFIAQDVEKAAKDADYDFDGVVKPQHDKDHYRLAYGEFVVPLVKAVQEQQAIIEQQQKQITELLKRIEALEKK